MNFLDATDYVFNSLKKNYYLYKLNNNVGRIYNDNDNYVCIISEKFIINSLDHDYFIVLDVLEFDKNYGSDSLDKSILYVFDCLEFESKVRLSGIGSSIIFSNCVFNKGVIVNSARSVMFENNILLNDSVIDLCSTDNLFLCNQSLTHCRKVDCINVVDLTEKSFQRKKKN